jgi:transcriptional regulator with XRE-family HTH domain
LTSRRVKITPQQAGMPDIGARRVPGLRRGEVAGLAGVSVEYYSKLERGSSRSWPPCRSSSECRLTAASRSRSFTLNIGCAALDENN